MDYFIPLFDDIVRIPIQPLLSLISIQGKLPGHAEFRAACNRGQGPFVSEISTLSYCMAYMYMHHDALISVLDLSINQDLILKDNPLIIIDIGCGPGTAGIAIKNYLDGHGGARDIYYIGVDISQHMLTLAEKFMNVITNECFSLFRDTKEALIWLNKVDLSNYCQYIVITSYLLSQNSMSESAVAEMAEMIKKIAEQMHHAEGHFVSTNIDTSRVGSSLNDFFPVLAQECLRRGIILPRATASLPIEVIRKPKTMLKYTDFFKDRAREEGKVCYVVGKIGRSSADAAIPSE